MRPLFIGGCDRSGTTLLGSMLGAHPEALATPESQFKTLLLAPAPFEAVATAKAVGDHWRFRLWGMQPDLGDWASASGPADLLSRLVRRYGAQVGKPAASVWVDHTPENLRLSLRLLELYPDARFIHIVRDGRAVAASVLDLDWGPNTIVEAGPWWAAKLAPCLAAEISLAERIRRVSYERLVTEPEATLRELSEFAGLSWDPAMIDAGGFAAGRYTAGQHALVGRRADPSRAEAWRQRLSRRDIELFEAATGDLLPLLGYPLETGSLAAPRGSRSERLRMAAGALLRRYAANPLRRRKRRGAALDH